VSKFRPSVQGDLLRPRQALYGPELLLTVVSFTLKLALPPPKELLKMPPPNRAELPLMVQLLTVSIAWSLKMPPPASPERRR
jgi:hypothetical protein